jgi:UDP-N-acetylmuramyl pentapeptide phosphotransferase/UDP-N-acetylglucosamine-1-phosphate transferase
MTAAWAVRGAATAVFSAIFCAVLIVILRPALQRYALAAPNARSSHREPTPQGGGIAVIVATIAAAYLGTVGLGAPIAPPPVAVIVSVALMACVGAVDDVRTIEVVPRLVLQGMAVAAVIYALPEHLRVVPVMPGWIEQALLFVGGLWFVNLVNFMDGIDWMTVAEVVPVAAALAVIGYLGALTPDGIVVALALGGAMVGFAYFNRPTAKLFLGDVGSLPIGLLLAWLLVLLAGNGGLAAALLLPLYYLADATVTLQRRLFNGEPVWRAHRTHFYQRAADRGWSVTAIVAHVFTVNLGLAVLALVTVMARSLAVDIAALLGGVALVGWLLHAFTHGRQSAPKSI